MMAEFGELEKMNKLNGEVEVQLWQREGERRMSRLNRLDETSN